MATPRARRRLSVEEYVELEEYANLKHEFIAGEMVAMAGGTPDHSVRATNLSTLLANALRGRRCRVQNSDARIRIDAADLNTYPDISVICGEAVTDSRDRNALTNPCLVAEVLSPGTEDYDRGDKLAAFQSLLSVREIVFVAHDERRVDVVQRGTDGTWTTISAGPGGTLQLALGVSIAVDDVYFDPLAD